jgi:hypothetical protein
LPPDRPGPRLKTKMPPYLCDLGWVKSIESWFHGELLAASRIVDGRAWAAPASAPAWSRFGSRTGTHGHILGDSLCRLRSGPTSALARRHYGCWTSSRDGLLEHAPAMLVLQDPFGPSRHEHLG